MTSPRLKLYGTLGGLFVALAVMVTLVSYSVTLYRLFCEATGAGGTTQRVAANDVKRSDASVSVSFFTHVAPGMPWRFTPVQAKADIHLGEDTLVFFEAENLSDHDITGHATFNVTPDGAGSYFKKIECFCFTEEKLAAHQKVEMPVDFFVDPRFADDPDTKDVRNITLSYTFFTSMNPADAPDLSRFATPDAATGSKLFAANCSGCHAGDRNSAGPKLGGVVGRVAGTTPGYPYSVALARSGVVWDADTLDRWLSGPSRFVPGALMQMSLDDPARRRDIIAYLETLRVTSPPPATPPA